MTPFAIFAFVLTFGYVIYFAIMITLDLTAKPADGQKNEEEDIYVGDMNDEGVESPKVINEDPGIEGGRLTYTDSVSDDGLRIINPTSTGLPSQDTEEAPADPEPAPGAKEKVTSEELNEERIQESSKRRMSVTICKYNHLLGVVVSGIMLFLPMSASAKCGGVDYSWGADALANAHDYTVTMMLYVVYLSYAIAGLVAVIGALQIYIKMQTGEGDITKSIMMLIGACLFMIGAYVLFPAFFGYNII